MSELKSPATFQINQFIKNKSQIEFHLINNEILSGQIVWQGRELFHILLANGKEITLYKNAIAYYMQV